MADLRELNDEAWDEVVFINSYALFIGYLSMAIKGLGFLVLTWTTVVLLGGFVSMLQKKDFWCLTFITLVQTAGIFDVYLNEKLSFVATSAMGSLAGVFHGLVGDMKDNSSLIVDGARLLLAFLSVGVQTLVLVILLCPLAATYMFGLLISMGLSIWRLVQHDYGSNSDGAANLKPAMDTLYYLALLQGLLFCYRFLFARSKKGLAKVVLDYKCNDNDEFEVILKYARETRVRCEMDPSFARGRNLVTHAVDLIGSNSNDDRVFGVKMLYTAICLVQRKLKNKRVEGRKEDCHARWGEIIGQHMIMKNLIITAPSSPVLHKLLDMLNPRELAYDRETRGHAARIVAHLALGIHLEKFPEAIQCICTLIGSFEEYRLIEPYHRDRLLYKYEKDGVGQASRLPSPGDDASNLREAYEKLVLTGLCILWKLATHKNNCTIMSQTQGLLPRIMAPLTSDIIHQFNGGAWSISLVEESLKVMFQLVATPGETGAKLRQEISSNKEAISTMERILHCGCCSAKLQKRAMGILLELYMDTKSRGAYIKMLVDIFVDDKKDMLLRKLAGQALAKLSIQDGSNAITILQVNGDVVARLTRILLLDEDENKTCRIRAAEIMEQMCILDDESLSKLKKEMTNTMPKVLEQILRCGLTKDETHGLAEADQSELPEKEIDIENQCDKPEDNAGNKSQVIAEVAVEMDMEVDEFDNDEDEEFHAPLLSLFVTVCDTFISDDQDLSSVFGTVDAMSLPKKLKKMVEDNSNLTVHCVWLVKLTCKMVISMMKHRGSYLKEDLERLMEALSSASERMSLLDVSMVFSSEHYGATTTMKPVRSLVSLVNEAKGSVDTYLKAQESEIVEPFTSTDELT